VLDLENYPLNFCPNCLPYTSTDIYSNRLFQGYEKKASQNKLTLYLFIISIGFVYRGMASFFLGKFPIQEFSPGNRRKLLVV
jgi:hypothetical protein